jgi:hypothetical protein
MRCVSLALWAVVTGLMIGCGGGGPAAATVSGEVKVDGVPLEKGDITFSPAEGKGDAVTVNIVKGKYEAHTTAGKKFVQISSPVVTEKRKESDAPNAAWIEFTGEGLPEKYNSKSELTFDAQAGSNTKNWDLEVKKK